MHVSRWYDGYVFDLDGTIYLGEELLPSVSRTLTALRERGARVRFLSNNPTKDPGQYLDKLHRLGIQASPDEITNTIVTTIGWLGDHRPGATVFPIAEQPLQRALSAAGFTLSEDPSQIDVVISSYDRTFDYRKLQIAFDAIWYHKRAILIETNPDRYCPFPGGRGEPDAAAITAAIETCTGTRCVASLGKPSPLMAAEAIRGWNLDPCDVLMVGDRLYTDIAMALDAGFASAFVLTGDSTLDDLAALPTHRHPTYVVERLEGILPNRGADAGR